MDYTDKQCVIAPLISEKKGKLSPYSGCKSAGNNVNLSQMSEKLKKMLSPHRYQHSLAVMETAKQMASRFEADIQQATVAGLLHDCAKDIPRAEQLAMCEQLHIHLPAETIANPAVIHGELGAYLVGPLFGVNDPAIKNAIRYHTLGRPGMTKLEQIIYLADCIEPTRKPYDGLEQVRRLAMLNLDAAMLACITLTIDHLRERGKPLHSQSLQTQQYYRTLAERPCKGVVAYR